MAMIFTLVTTLKDAAELLVSERLAAIQAQKDVVARQAEAEENRKFEGTKVTPESFLEWSARFKAEIAEAKKRAEEIKEAEEKKKKGSAKEEKMTGRELWARGLAGNVLDEDEEGAIDALAGMKTLKVES